jgi:YhcH/YjgK/YiaL family protein
MSKKANEYDLAWYEKGDWKEGLQVQADESVAKEEFIRHYGLDPKRWQAAFHFLASSDLSNLPAGKHKIEGDQVFAVVSEYFTKTPEELKYEVHHRYADIQMVISGEELIGYSPLSHTLHPSPYDREKDVYFVEPKGELKYLYADPSRIFIFFTDDAHLPGLSVKGSDAVKKVIVKVQIV